ncbi:hypothetical protein [Actinopolymorpha pittospori]|uniref:Uncharacterized protein n=1 Tax=Actinopolymorpha pittospori TaxID=648752 RepID=A0A927RHG7_9ACTN|nr:hypothetical protein [Actinopolymorpha pittospori]MBE1605191.1 hypothetical protein [Actinopolymorpha pittospori]
MNGWAALALIVLIVLMVICLAAWNPAYSQRLDRSRWWVVVVVFAALLALAGLLATGASDVERAGHVAAVVLAVVVAVAGGAPVTSAILRGAEQSGMPDITHPTAPGPVPPTGPATGASGPPGGVGPGGPAGGYSSGLGGGSGQGGPGGQGGQGATRRLTGGAAPPPHQPAPGRPVLRGGVWIGALERAAVASCLLAGFGEGVAIVLAVKGLGRYPELRAPGAAERFIIGTFTSLLWAGGAAGVASLLLR